VEPNPFLHRHILNTARQVGLPIQLREESAEMLGLEDESVDSVVGTLVLCSVEEPQHALAEIIRVLKPGGTFVFVEHVAAPPNTLLRSLQWLVRPVWQCVADGCRPNRDTLGYIEQAGFRSVQSERFRLPVAIVAPHISGTAIK
jgi:ubiquinone/menaquinone biosynthesis C-methylase UbiE